MAEKELIVFDESDSKLRAVSVDSLTGLGQVIEQAIIDEVQPFKESDFADAEAYLLRAYKRANDKPITLKKDQDGIYRPAE